METHNGIPAFHAKTEAEWRAWLMEHSATEKTVWLILYHKKSSTPSVSYNEAIEQALCFGWIDSKANKRDAESYYLTFTPRKPKSNWSKPNHIRVAKMAELGLIMPQGQAMIDLAKETGRWEPKAS